MVAKDPTTSKYVESSADSRDSQCMHDFLDWLDYKIEMERLRKAVVREKKRESDEAQSTSDEPNMYFPTTEDVFYGMSALYQNLFDSGPLPRGHSGIEIVARLKAVVHAGFGTKKLRALEWEHGFAVDTLGGVCFAAIHERTVDVFKTDPASRVCNAAADIWASQGLLLDAVTGESVPWSTYLQKKETIRKLAKDMHTVFLSSDDDDTSEGESSGPKAIVARVWNELDAGAYAWFTDEATLHTCPNVENAPEYCLRVRGKEAADAKNAESTGGENSSGDNQQSLSKSHKDSGEESLSESQDDNNQGKEAADAKNAESTGSESVSIELLEGQHVELAPSKYFQHASDEQLKTNPLRPYIFGADDLQSLAADITRFKVLEKRIIPDKENLRERLMAWAANWVDGGNFDNDEWLLVVARIVKEEVTPTYDPTYCYNNPAINRLGYSGIVLLGYLIRLHDTTFGTGEGKLYAIGFIHRGLMTNHDGDPRPLSWTEFPGVGGKLELASKRLVKDQFNDAKKFREEKPKKHTPYSVAHEKVNKDLDDIVKFLVTHVEEYYDDKDKKFKFKSFRLKTADTDSKTSESPGGRKTSNVKANSKKLGQDKKPRSAPGNAGGLKASSVKANDKQPGQDTKPRSAPGETSESPVARKRSSVKGNDKRPGQDKKPRSAPEEAQVLISSNDEPGGSSKGTGIPPIVERAVAWRSFHENHTWKFICSFDGALGLFKTADHPLPATTLQHPAIWFERLYYKSEKDKDGIPTAIYRFSLFAGLEYKTPWKLTVKDCTWLECDDAKHIELHFQSGCSAQYEKIVIIAGIQYEKCAEGKRVRNSNQADVLIRELRLAKQVVADFVDSCKQAKLAQVEPNFHDEVRKQYFR